MKTSLRFLAVSLIALLSSLPPALPAKALGPVEGIEVPDGTRKCIKPASREPGFVEKVLAPYACTAPVVNVSARTGNESESFVVVNPTNTNNIVALSNLSSANSIFRGYSFDGGATWTRGTIATGVACCDAQSAWDSFGNLFVVYINNSVNQINVIVSTDGGVTFSAPVTVGTGSVDQPSIAVGNGSVWVDWNVSGSMVARGAPVTGLGAWGPFNAQQSIPSGSGSFGGIAVGPGPNGGKVIVTYQNPTGGQGPATIFANVDADGLGAGAFGPQISVTSTNVGGFDFIPAQSGRSIDAEAGVVWDGTGGAFNSRIYLVYTDETVNENNDTEIFVRRSTDDGSTWSAPVRVNDDPTGVVRSQFLPYMTLDRTSGTVAVGFHDCRNDNGVAGSGGTNATVNDDAEYYGTFSTDGGVTWAANTRLSGGFSNAAAAGNGIDYGDYVGINAQGGKLFAVWADNANCDGTNADGTLHAFDLYSNKLMLSGGVPTPTITADSATITAGNCGNPTTTTIEPGETVTLSLCVRNIGNLATTNLVGTLQATGGVTQPSAPQSYGAVPPGGSAVCRSFTFTATGACGGQLTVSLQLTDGANNLGTATYTFTMGSIVTLSSTNMDSVTPPALPSGWTADQGTNGAASPLWVTSNSGTPTPVADSAPNSAYTVDPGSLLDNRLYSPVMNYSTGTQLTFRQNYDLEQQSSTVAYDAGVLEMAVNGGGWTDIVTAGGVFTAGGYSHTGINTGFSNPLLPSRPCWSGVSGGFQTTTVNLPDSAAGQAVQFRWRMGSDSSVSHAGWRVDNVALQKLSCPCAPVPQAIVSRKSHSGPTFDIPLPLSGMLGVECRSGGSGGNFQVVVNFAAPVTAGSASVSPPSGGAVSSFSVSGSQLTVNLTSVLDAQRLTVNLNNVTDGTNVGNLNIPMGILLGDATGDGSVNSGDVIVTRGRSGQPLDATTFRSDFNLDGVLNAGDVTIVRGRSGQFIP